MQPKIIIILFATLLSLIAKDLNLTLQSYLENVRKNNLQNQLNSLNPRIQKAIYKENKYTGGYLGTFTGSYSQNKTDALPSLVPNGEKTYFDLGWNYKLLPSGTVFSTALKHDLSENNTSGDEKWVNTLSFRVTQPLLRGGFINNENERYLDVNKFNAQLAESQYNKDYANLIAQAISLYWQYQINLENFNFQLETLKNSRDILNFNKRKLALSAISELDVLENESQIINAEIQLRETQKNLEVLKQNLLVFMGIPLKENKNITLKFDDALEIKKPNANEDEAFNQASNNRDEIKDLAIQGLAAKNSKVLAKLGFLPRLDFFMQYDIIGEDDSYSGAFSDMGFGFDNNDLKWGLNLSFYTDIGAYRVPTERPNLLVEQADKNYTLFIENLRKEINQRVTEINDAYNSYLKNQQKLNIQTKKFKLSTEKYLRGEINFAIQTNNENSKISAQIAYLTSKFTFVQARINLKLTQGTLLSENNLQKIPISDSIPFK